MIIAIIFYALWLYTPYTNDKYNDTEIPKDIWTFWHDDNLPEIIERSIDTWKRTNSDYKIHVVTKSNLEYYLPGNDIFLTPHCKDSIQRASDFIRLELLYKYGGFWIDASVILNGSLNYFRDIQRRGEYEILAYYLSKFTTRPEFPVIENWFLAAVPESRVIKIWLDCFSHINGFDKVDKYVEWVKNEGIDLQGIIIPNYLSMHVAFQHMIQDKKFFSMIKNKIYWEKAENGPYLYLDKNNWDSNKALLNACKDKNLRTLVFKMRGKERSEMNKNPDLYCIFDASSK